MKDLHSKRQLAHRENKDEVYELKTKSSIIQTGALALIGTITNMSTWHQHLGHPSHKILQLLLMEDNLACDSVNYNKICVSCSCNKAQKLPFSFLPYKVPNL